MDIAIIQLLLAKVMLGAAGNRAIGHSAWWSNPLGYWFLSIAICISLPVWMPPVFGYQLLTFFPILLACVMWRSRSPRPWLDMTHTPAWKPALVRGLYILPLVAILAWFSMVYLFGLILVVVPCGVYWLAGKQTRYEPVALAEIFTGAIIPLAFSATLL